MTTVAKTARQGDVEFQRALYSDPNPTRSGLHCQRRDWVLNHALTLSSRNDRILEVGVGCGVFTEALVAAGRKVTAVDINSAFLENVAGLEGVSTHLKDATTPLGLGVHDLAICSEVLEHVPPERSVAMLGSIYNSLRPDGALILTTPQSYSTVELGARLLRFGPMLALARRIYGSADELGHINLLTAGTLRKQIEAVGFDIIQQRRFGFYLPVVAEFGGKSGAWLLGKIENAIRPLPLIRGALWTQGWILRRP